MNQQQRNQIIDDTHKRNKYLGWQPSWENQVNALYSRPDFMDYKYTPDVRDSNAVSGKKLGMGGLNTSESANYFFTDKNIQLIADKTGYANDALFQDKLQQFFREKLILANVWTKQEGVRLTNLAINKLAGTRPKSSYNQQLPAPYPVNATFWPDRPQMERKEKVMELNTGFMTPSQFNAIIKNKSNMN